MTTMEILETVKVAILLIMAIIMMIRLMEGEREW